MAWLQGTYDAELLGPYRPTGGPPVPYGAYGNYLVPIGAVHEGTPADGPASSSFGLLGALGSRGAHDLSTGPRILASLNTDAATFAVNDGAAPHRSRPEQVGYHRDATTTLSQTPGAGNPSAEAPPSQIQGVLNPGGGLARQAAGVAKAGPVVIGSGPESSKDDGPQLYPLGPQGDYRDASKPQGMRAKRKPNPDPLGVTRSLNRRITAVVERHPQGMPDDGVQADGERVQEMEGAQRIASDPGSDRRREIRRRSLAIPRRLTFSIQEI